MFESPAIFGKNKVETFFSAFLPPGKIRAERQKFNYLDFLGCVRTIERPSSSQWATCSQDLARAELKCRLGNQGCGEKPLPLAGVVIRGCSIGLFGAASGVPACVQNQVQHSRRTR
jgi:hypothetical protein